MKVVIIGGTGLIGSRVVTMLRDQGHEAVAASPASGVNTLTGEGLAAAFAGAAAVVDVSNSPTFDTAAALSFFETSTSNILAAEKVAGVRHHVALSVVGTDRLAESGYFRAKLVQERLIGQSPIPWSIVHATQFFEFLERMIDEATVGNTVRLPPVLFQPMAADDVARAVERVVVEAPLNGMIEVAGPQQFRFDELVRQTLAARGDPREVITDAAARYFTATVGERTLLPGDDARLGDITLEAWRSRNPVPKAKAMAAGRT